MSLKDKSAFPSWKVEQADQGMNVREKFAETAMIGILSSEVITNSIITRDGDTQLETHIFFKEVSRMSVEAADALIAALEKTKEKE
jgi:hypothetical protein